LERRCPVGTAEQWYIESGTVEKRGSKRRRDAGRRQGEWERRGEKRRSRRTAFRALMKALDEGEWRDEAGGEGPGESLRGKHEIRGRRKNEGKKGRRSPWVRMEEAGFLLSL